MKNVYDIIGIGIGPFNLSVLALLEGEKNIKKLFLDQKNEFNWHPGMMFEDAFLQNSHLKDLVSLADSNNAFSFLSFLHDKKRLYEWLNANYKRPLRVEYNQYLQWVCTKLDHSISWCEKVTSVHLVDDLLVINSNNKKIYTKNVVIGIGMNPFVPGFFYDFINDDYVFHNSFFLLNKNKIELKNKSITIIGGGQSGAELFLNLSSDNEIKKITWITDRLLFNPIDESPFANEIFTPSYINYFSTLSFEERKNLNKQHVLLSDGISHDTAEKVYQTLYYQKYLNSESSTEFSIFPHMRVLGCKKPNKNYVLNIENLTTKKEDSIESDIIILATGYKQEIIPEILHPIKDLINLENGYMHVGSDFSINYSGKPKIFILNASKHSHGVSEPNLSIMAYRSSKIVNSIIGHNKFIIPQIESFQSF